MTVLAAGVLAPNPVTVGMLTGAVGALAGRFVAPQIAVLFAERGAVVRAGLDAALGCALALTATLITATLLPADPDGGAIAAVTAGTVTALGVAWGSGRGVRPSGGPDDLAGGRARRLGAWLGVLAAAPLLFG